ncbi:hypothetical protein [Proteiniphilum sp.]|uniref:hypothetical protein n=1 Tax=Proteiniphilum sp. TaxID=1926877 RepID=UPI003A599B96
MYKVLCLSSKNLGSKNLGSINLGSKSLGSKSLGSISLGSISLDSKSLLYADNIQNIDGPSFQVCFQRGDRTE